jgi:hypothetical protein
MYQEEENYLQNTEIYQRKERNILSFPTKEQRKILIYLGQGYSYKRISDLLENEEQTCKNLMGHGTNGVLHRLQMQNLFGVIFFCLEKNFIQPQEFQPPIDLKQK